MSSRAATIKAFIWDAPPREMDWAAPGGAAHEVLLGFERSQNFSGLFGRLRDQASSFEGATGARDAFRQEELNVFFDARDGADVLALHVEEQRAGDRVFASGDGVVGRNNAVDGRNLEGVLVLVVERQTKHADGVGVRGQASQGLGVVGREIDNNVM